MAELNHDAAGCADKPKKIRSRKLHAKVDLTAMVDLAFLLITFFMLTTSLAKPRSMNLTMPDDGKPGKVNEHRTLTVLIDEGDKLKCYMGMFSLNAPKEIAIGKDFRAEVAARKKEALAYSAANDNPGQGLIVLIKPSKNSNYGNLVDVLDEMAISEVPTYAITDLTAQETRYLAR